MKTQAKPIHRLISTILLLFALTLATPVAAETVIVPIKLDYPLLRHLMLSQLFNSADQSAEILHDPAHCNKVFLSDPRIREHQQKLEITTHVKASVATAIFGACTSLFNWEGDAKFITEPVILQGARSVRLNVLTTRLYNQQGQIISSGALWELADGQLQSLLSRYEVDLSPSVNELNKLLPDVLNRHSAQQLKGITDSLSLAAITVEADGIDVDVSLQINRLPASPQSEAVLSSLEMQQMEANWQRMDAMITFAVKYYASVTHLQDLREALLEILLDARYRLNDALAMPVTRANDPVRHWFIDSWQKLGPVLRRISLETPGHEPMLLISLLTATNALDALDRLGPSIGLDISVEGLRRMGRMLIDQPGIDPLRYEDAVDPELRRLFQLPTSPEPIEPSRYNFNLWPIRSVWAKTDDRLNRWLPKKSELHEYLPKIRDLLNASAEKTIKQSKLNSSTTKVYRHLLLTTAWQESCWRQYVQEKGKLVPLRSNTGDTGLMQMNERVWRGLYDTQKLRWDINYNVQAGAEVLMQYLVKYALKRGEHKHQGGVDNLARSAYSTYNGGPRQVSRYRNPQVASVHKKVDSAFWKKYQAVKRGKELQVAECLGGDATRIAAAPEKKSTQKKSSRPKLEKHSAVAGKRLGKSWALAQNKQYYTLQLAVFSSLNAAQKFTTSNSLQGVVAIVPMGKGKQDQFIVLNGSYKKRAEADRLKQRYKKLKPWVRQFKDIQL